MNIDYRVITNLQRYTQGRAGQPILHIVLHTYDGVGDDLYNWFQNLSPGTSAHYSVSLTGKVRQYVWEADTAHHSGNALYNYRSIGIEHQDNGQPTGVHRTEEQYNASAQLVYEICVRNSIPIDRSRIVLHREVLLDGNNPARCPGNLDINKIISKAQAIQKDMQENIALKIRISELQTTNSNLSKSLSDSLKTNQELKDNQVDMQRQLDDLEKEIEPLIKERKELQKEVANKDKEIERLSKLAADPEFQKSIFYSLYLIFSKPK